jgi:hypothetical protein
MTKFLFYVCLCVRFSAFSFEAGLVSANVFPILLSAKGGSLSHLNPNFAAEPDFPRWGRR